jgi:hypothetical protein
MTTEDTQTCRRGHSESSDPAGDQMVSDILDAAAKRIGTDVYLDLRSSGATHAQVLEVSDWQWAGFPPLKICASAIHAGATIDELREINATSPTDIDITPGWRATLYAQARADGATHAEFLSIDEHTTDLSELEDVLDQIVAGEADHKRMIAYLNAGGIGIHSHWYQEALSQGLNDPEILEVVSHQGGIAPYVGARQKGITHEEVMEVLHAGLSLSQYSGCRHKLDHAKALELLTAND